MGILINSSFLASREILRRPLRSTLTVLGIIIGVLAIITMVTVGKGASQNIVNQLNGLGVNTLQIYAGANLLTPAQLTTIETKIRGLSAISPEDSSAVQVFFGKENSKAQVAGITQDYFKVNGFSVSAGRSFSALEVRSGAAVCIIGRTLQKKLFKNKPPIGNLIRLNKLPCQVIGILKSKKVGFMQEDPDNQVLLPLKTLQSRILGQQNFSKLNLTVKSTKEINRVKQELTTLLRELHHLKPEQDDDFYINDPRDLLATVNDTSRSLNLFLAAIGSISLLVGGIGIMNIMLASVHERTREIGIRLAIGALRHEVLLQFLIEAVLLALFGGLIGVVLAVFLSMGVSRIIDVPYIFDLKINLIAFIFSAIIGVVFGYLPARRAAQLDPIDALRHE